MSELLTRVLPWGGVAVLAAATGVLVAGGGGEGCAAVVQGCKRRVVGHI